MISGGGCFKLTLILSPWASEVGFTESSQLDSSVFVATAVRLSPLATSGLSSRDCCRCGRRFFLFGMIFPLSGRDLSAGFAPRRQRWTDVGLINSRAKKNLRMYRQGRSSRRMHSPANFLPSTKEIQGFVTELAS